MSGYSVSLPISLDYKDGFTEIKDFKGLTRQNLKMLLLTNPGERVMVPDFGVGIKKYLFELTDGTIIYNVERNVAISGTGKNLKNNLEEAIRQQVNKFMSYITIIEITTEIDGQALAVGISYSIPSINSTDKFFYIDTNNSIILDSNITDNTRNLRENGNYRNFSVDLTKETFEK